MIIENKDRIEFVDVFIEEFSSSLYRFMGRRVLKKDTMAHVSASCLKQTIEGDFNMVKVDEIENLMISNGAGRIER